MKRIFATSFDLDFKLVGLDLDSLIKARNSVAHSGRLAAHPAGADKHSSDLLKKGQYCLQLLILQILRYQGMVNHSKNGMLSIVDIEEALKTVRTIMKKLLLASNRYLELPREKHRMKMYQVYQYVLKYLAKHVWNLIKTRGRNAGSHSRCGAFCQHSSMNGLLVSRCFSQSSDRSVMMSVT